jgi:hypothetical protein
MAKTKTPEKPEITPAPEMSPAMRHAMALREEHMAEGRAWRDEHMPEYPQDQHGGQSDEA